METDVRTIIPIVPISRDKLIGMLYGLKGSEIVTIHTNTDARLRKTSKVDKTIKNPFINPETNKVEVRKISKVNGLFNISYENCVNNQLEREGKENDFEVAPKQWGEKVNDSKTLMQHVNKDGEYGQYVQFNPRKCLETFYQDNEGNKISKEDIADFISDKKVGSRQGTDKEIIWRTYKTSSIFAVTMNKTHYVVTDNATSKINVVKDVGVATKE